MKQLISVLLVLSMALLLSSCGQQSPEPEPFSLEGTWVQTNAPSLSDYQAMYITNKYKYMEIYWIIGYNELNSAGTAPVDAEAEVPSLYYAGSFDPPPANTAGNYSWTSSPDTGRTQESLMTSNAKSINFSYEDGMIRYTLEMNGGKSEVWFERRDWDHDTAMERDQTEINYYDFTDTEYSVIRKLNIKQIMIDVITAEHNKSMQEIRDAIAEAIREADIG